MTYGIRHPILTVPEMNPFGLSISNMMRLVGSIKISLGLWNRCTEISHLQIEKPLKEFITMIRKRRKVSIKKSTQPRQESRATYNNLRLSMLECSRFLIDFTPTATLISHPQWDNSEASETMKVEKVMAAWVSSNWQPWFWLEFTSTPSTSLELLLLQSTVTSRPQLMKSLFLLLQSQCQSLCHPTTWLFRLQLKSYE